MQRYVWAVVLMALLCGGAGLAQEGKGPDRNAVERAHVKMQLRRQRLELEKVESEMAFKNQMRELELEKRRIDVKRERTALRPRPHSGRATKCHGWPFVLICAVVNVLLAVWVFMDVRSRKTASGLWIVITLLAGFFGALIYAVVRQGDMQARE